MMCLSQDSVLLRLQPNQASSLVGEVQVRMVVQVAETTAEVGEEEMKMITSTVNPPTQGQGQRATTIILEVVGTTMEVEMISFPDLVLPRTSSVVLPLRNHRIIVIKTRMEAETCRMNLVEIFR